jgi:hypothetical protein
MRRIASVGAALRCCAPALGVALVAASALVSAGAQQGPAVRTNIGIRVGRLAGILGDAPFTIVQVRGPNVDATSAPVVRSNTAWRLIATLPAPVDPKLTVRVSAGGRTVALDAASPRATIATGAAPCASCTVRLDWTFQFGASNAGRKGAMPTLPSVVYTAEPAP